LKRVQKGRFVNVLQQKTNLSKKPDTEMGKNPAKQAIRFPTKERNLGPKKS